MERLELSSDDREIISELTNGGYGWAKYAFSVEKQGWLSRSQRAVMCNMVNRLRMIQGEASFRRLHREGQRLRRTFRKGTTK